VNFPTYKQGDLVEITRSGTFTLCYIADDTIPSVRECPVQELEVHTDPRDYYKNIFENLEGKIGLIVYVSRNRLDQILGYRLLIEGKRMFCKTIVADKYFKAVENQDDETGGSSKI